MNRRAQKLVEIYSKGVNNGVYSSVNRDCELCETFYFIKFLRTYLRVICDLLGETQGGNPQQHYSFL